MNLNAISESLGKIIRHPLFALIIVFSFVSFAMYAFYTFFLSKKSAEEKEILYKKLDFSLDFINLFFLVVTTVIFSSLLFFYRKIAPIQEQLQDVLENTRTVKNIAEKLEGLVDMTNNATAEQISSAQGVLDSYIPAVSSIV